MADAKTYKAPHSVYTGGKLYNAGEPFTTAEAKGDKWETVSKAEKAASDAAQPGAPDDPNYDALNLTALQAVAAEKKVAFEGLNEKDLIVAIKAANEPKL